MKLADAFSLIRNGASIKQYDNATGIPITRIETISNRVVDRNKCGYADIFDVGKYQDYVLQDGDILMSHINSVQHLGKTALYNKIDGEVLIHGMNLLVLRPKKKILEPKYAYIALNSLKFLRQLPRITKKSVNQASFSVSDLRKVDIDVPSIPKQKEIAHTVMQIDRMIANRQRALSVADELVKSRFVEMFGDNTYPKVKSAEICDFITKGTTPASKDILPSEEEDTIPYLKVYNLSFTGDLLFRQEPQYISREIHEGKLARSKVYPNDVLMNIVGPPLGKFALVTDEYSEWNINQAIAIFRAKERILPKFLLSALMQEKVIQPFIDQAVGVRQLNISLEQCRNLELILPPLEEQKKYVSFIEQVDKSKIVIQKNIDMLQILKNKLMQDCFR